MESLKGMSLGNIVERYSERIARQAPELPMVVLDVNRPELEKKMQTAVASAAISEPSENCIRGLDGHIEKQTSLISCTLVDEAAPLSLVALKIEKSEVGYAYKDPHLQLILMKGDFRNVNLQALVDEIHEEGDSLVADMIIKDQPNYLLLTHRLVNGQYRRQGFGDMMLKAIETYVQEKYGDQDRSVIVRAAQLDVILWLLNKDFEPTAEMDRKRLEEITEGDKSLCIGERLNVFPSESNPDKRTHYNFLDKVYVTLKKPVKAKADQTTQVIKEDVRDEIAGILP